MQIIIVLCLGLDIGVNCLGLSGCKVLYRLDFKAGFAVGDLNPQLHLQKLEVENYKLT